MGLGEETDDAGRHDRSDIGHVLQGRRVGGQQGIEVTEMSGEIARRRFTDVADAQREDETVQRRLARCGNGGTEIHCRFLAHALQACQRVGGKPVEIDRCPHLSRLDQLIDQFFAEALDVHRPPAGKVTQRLFALCRADQAAAAARNRLVFPADHGRPAFGAEIGQGERRVQGFAAEQIAGRSPFHDHRHHFRDDIASAADDDGIADADVLAPRLIGVVQRCVGHRHPAHEHRLQSRYRRDRAGSADLYVDGLDSGQRLLRRIFVGDRPAWLSADKTELRLLGNGINLIDHAVDVERQTVALREYPLMKRDQRRRTGSDHAMFAYGQAKGRQCVERFAVGRRPQPASHFANAVSVKRQRALGGQFRIELADATGGAVARIDQRRLAQFTLPCVVALEIRPAHEHFAAHLKHRRRGADQAQWNLADGADVLRDILAGFAVAARRRLGQHTVDIAQADRQTVELELGGINHGRRIVRQPQPPANPVVESQRPLRAGIGFGADRQHRHGMTHRRKGRQRLAADALCR